MSATHTHECSKNKGHNNSNIHISVLPEAPVAHQNPPGLLIQKINTSDKP